MSPSLLRNTVRLAALCALALAGSSCRDKNPVQPGPGGGTSLETIWPHADGTGWTYHLVQQLFSDTVTFAPFATLAEVPPAPSLSQLATQLGSLPNGPIVSSESGTYALQFSGQITTSSGVIAQNLLETVTPAPSRSAAGAVPADPLLASIYLARPDLRPRLARLARLPDPAAAGQVSVVARPLFLHGYAWRSTPAAILGYGDIDTLPAWRFLEANLSQGHEFRQQLVPALASDIWLHGRMLTPSTVITPGGTFMNAKRCLYLVDYGVSAITDAGGAVLGYGRDVSYGTITFANGLGPVASSERNLVHVVAPGKLSVGFAGSTSAYTGSLPVAPLAAR